jgi:phosphatidylserine decarboxylase
VVGRVSRVPLPGALRRAALSAFARAVGANLDEPELKLERYGTLGAFFARRLRAGARPVDEAAGAVVAPADGLVTAVGVVDAGTLIQAKGQAYALADLVADPALARALDGAAYATVYLSPRDYHRVHTPIAGRLTGWSYVPGARWPVGLRYTRRVPGLYARNERAIARLDTEHGPAAVVLVAALGVGNLWLGHAGRPAPSAERSEAGPERGVERSEPLDPPPGEARPIIGLETGTLRGAGERRRIDVVPPRALARGDELGAFLLGSTVIALLPPGAGRFTVQAGDVVRCGQRIGGTR